MRKTIRKANSLTWNFDKEEKWLNEMAGKGWCLISVGYCRYEFEECEPGEYRICMQMLEKSEKNPESKKYIEFVENTGAEHIGTYHSWVYFRKKSSDGPFELFSDNASRIKYISRITGGFIFLTPITLLHGLLNLVSFFLNRTNIPNSIHLLLGLIEIAIGIPLLIGLIKLTKIRKKLKQEGQLFE